MADSRILHRAAGDSEKVAALSDLEYRVWTQYVLSADDFGVMPALAFVLQADNRALRQKPTRLVQKALEAVIASGLILVFVHQGQRYVWQHDWQDWQSIRYPRATVRPLPNDIRAATAKTIKLFGEHASRLKEYSGDPAETSPIPTGAGGRETQTLTPTPTQAPTQTQARSERQNYGPPLVGSPLAHRAHGWCNDRGLCVPANLYAELLARLGRHREAEFRAWLGSVVDSVGETSPGDDIFDFWRNNFAAWVGTVTVKPSTVSTKSSRTIAAGKSLDAKLAAGAEINPFGTNDYHEAQRKLAEKASA